jgi:hypothetical protein
MDLFDLEPDEIEVLFYRCRDQTPTQIQVALEISSGEFFNRQTAAFTKLAIPGQPKQKFDNFRRKGLCEIVRQLTIEDIRNWYERRAELRKKLMPPSPGPTTNGTTDKSTSQRRQWMDNNRRKVWISVAGLLVLVLAVGSFLLERCTIPPPPPPTPTFTSTQEVPVTETPTSLPTVSPTLAFTDTPTLTVTPQTPTLTPTETATPQPAVLFETTFDQGLPEGMERLYGNIDFVDGELVAHDLTLLAIGEDTWKNYQIEYDARKHPACFGLKENGIAAHAISPENMVMWSWNYCETGWFEIVNGEWTDIAHGEGLPVNPGTMNTFKLVANNGNFEIYINNRKISTYFNDKYLQGKAYILVSDSSVIDNVRVSQLP